MTFSLWFSLVWFSCVPPKIILCATGGMGLNCTEISEGDFSPSNSYFMVEELSTQYIRTYLFFDNLFFDNIRKIVQRVMN